jgi:hypothetical protein
MVAAVVAALLMSRRADDEGADAEVRLKKAA